MQIIIKENEAGIRCLFDTRSDKFFEGGCISNNNDGNDLLDLANTIVRKSFRNIVELADFPVYGDNGYLEHMLAKKYLSLNPDIRVKLAESREKAKERINKKMVVTGGKKRGRKPKNHVKIDTGEPVIKRGRGRPRKNPIVSPSVTVM